MLVENIEITKTSKDQKKEIIKRVTEKLSEITNMPKQSIIVRISENDSDNIDVGSVMLSELDKEEI